MILKNIIFGILAIILGEVSLILFTTITQEILFDGVDSHSSITTIIFGGFFTFLAAIFAGLISRIIGRNYSITIPSIISFFIMTEVTYLILSQVTQDPIWFNLISGSGLIIAIWIGYHHQEIKNSFLTKTYNINTF